MLVGQTLSPWLSARALTGMFSSRHVKAYEHLPVLHDQAWLSLESSRPLPLQLDGEYVGSRDRVARQPWSDARKHP